MPNIFAGVKVARAIYKFIETHNGDEWQRVVHMKLNIPDPELKLLHQTYREDLLECKYQTILKWKRFQRMGIYRFF